MLSSSLQSGSLPSGAIVDVRTISQKSQYFCTVIMLSSTCKGIPFGLPLAINLWLLKQLDRLDTLA